MSFTFDSEGMKKAVEGGEEFMAVQKAHVEEVAKREADRRAALPVEPLPEGYYNSKEEAEAALDAARAAGKHPQRIDDGSGNFPYAIKISAPFNGYQEVWMTAVSNSKDPAFPEEG